MLQQRSELPSAHLCDQPALFSDVAGALHGVEQVPCRTVLQHQPPPAVVLKGVEALQDEGAGGDLDGVEVAEGGDEKRGDRV